ncbi:hypothetical protein [Streptosporangium sp. NPDC000396]|uniref:hypothetical protein n=1 Tax=Streptosporangium sp. NPDC000396 TaxID=3366185 RepID=UPI00367D397A
MRERTVRRRCRELLRQLGIRPPLDVADLCRRFGEWRGRPVKLVPYPFEVPGPSGLWIQIESADYIFYQERTSAPHQDHIILHELGHVFADHPSDELDIASYELHTSSPPSHIRRILRRTCYETDHEREAELIATIILEWASVLNVTHTLLLDENAPHGEQLNTSLINHQGWL